MLLDLAQMLPLAGLFLELLVLLLLLHYLALELVLTEHSLHELLLFVVVDLAQPDCLLGQRLLERKYRVLQLQPRLRLFLLRLVVLLLDLL